MGRAWFTQMFMLLKNLKKYPLRKRRDHVAALVDSLL